MSTLKEQKHRRETRQPILQPLICFYLYLLGRRFEPCFSSHMRATSVTPAPAPLSHLFLFVISREEVRAMFQHSYDSYLSHAYPYDELRPLTCDGVDTWGSYSLTLIDALDTLAVMGNFSEFNRSVNTPLLCLKP